MTTLSTSFYLRRAAKDGTSVTVDKTNTYVQYAVSTSATTAPTSGWQSTVPTVPDGSYLWTKTVVTYSDDASTTAYSVSSRGKQGDTGESAWSVRLSPEVLSFTADKNGTVTGDNGTSTKSTTVSVYYGENLASITALSVVTSSLVGIEAKEVAVSLSNSTVGYTPARVLVATTAEGTKKYVPATAGSAMFKLTASATDADGNPVTAELTFTVPFTCDVCTQYGELIANDSTFKSSLTEISSDLSTAQEDITKAQDTADSASQGLTTLTTKVSTIEQTATEISLQVKQSTARNNLIPASWLNMVSNDATGVTCKRQVQLKADTVYMFTVEGRVVTASKMRCFVFMVDSTGAWKESNVMSYDTSTKTWKTRAHAFVDITAQTLTTASVAFKVATAGTYYIGFYNGTSSSATGYIHVYRVKLEVAQKAGDTYIATSWTSCKDDEGTGTNILPPIQQYATEVVTGADGLQHEAAVADSSAIADSYLDVVFSPISEDVVLCAGETYTLSFLAKAKKSDEVIKSYLYATSGTSTGTVCQGSINTDTAETPSKSGDGLWTTEYLSTEWQRITITFTTKTTLPAGYTIIMARLMKNTNGGKCYFYDFKLECGGRWTGAGVTEDALNATGIDIKNRLINITSDQLNVYNNSGELTMSVDEDGNLVPISLQTKPAADGSYTSIKGGLINIVGKNAGNAAGNRIAFGVSEETNLITMYYYGSTGSLIWYLNNAGLKYVAAESDAYFIVETNLIPCPAVLKGVAGGSTLATAKKLTTAQFTAIQKVGAVNTYVYHAPYTIDSETKEETIVQDNTYGLYQEEAEEYNTCLFKTEPTTGAALGAGIDVFRTDVAGADETEYYLVCIYAVGSITKYARYPVIDGVNRYTTAGITDDNYELAPTYYYYDSDHPTA